MSGSRLIHVARIRLLPHESISISAICMFRALYVLIGCYVIMTQGYDTRHKKKKKARVDTTEKAEGRENL